MTGGTIGSAPTTTTATTTFNFTNNGNSTAQFTMVATPTGGGTAGVVTATPVSFSSGSGSPATVTFTFNPPLDINQNYNFQVNATQANSSPASFNVASSTNVDIVCFLPGTMIATPKGEVAVETLAMGDLVMTADGRAVAVLWLGQQTASTVFGMPETGMPVRIAAGALGGGLPVRDRCVPSAPALLPDAVLVNARALVNDATITRMRRDELGETFAVFHVETENHEVILAEGVATETFMDNVSRTRFDNYAEFEAKYGAEGNAKAELDQPRAMSPRQVPASILARIAAQLPASDLAAA